MSENFWLRQEGQYSLMLSAPDEDVREEQLVVEARMLARDWNRRRAARNCPEHVWGEEFQMNEEVFGPGVFNAICTRCHVTRLSWETQQREEALR